jgi:ADP-ribosyl-[dinitrogen reductase] hydrolase
MPHLFRIERVRGCLLGMAVGDALGAPLEGLSPQQIKTHYGRVTNYVDGVLAWKRKPHRWRMPGLYTDDTQQALALCDVLLDCQCVDQDRLADLYLGLMTPKGPFSGASAKRSGQPTAGIGAAMRIAPVALYFGDETGPMFDSVMAASLMTHRDIRSLSGALAVAHGVRRLAEGQPRDPSLLFRVAADVVRDEAKIAALYGDQVLKLDRHAGGLARAIAHAESLLDLPLEQALQSLVTEANRHGAEPVCRRATMGFPPACIPTCFYILLTTNSFEQALTEVVNLGGDTDTAGAILGALAGAYYGASAIPERWLEGLQNREGIDAWAIALAHRSRRGIHLPDLISTEQFLTRKEGESFESFASVSRSTGEQVGDDLV